VFREKVIINRPICARLLSHDWKTGQIYQFFCHNRDNYRSNLKTIFAFQIFCFFLFYGFNFALPFKLSVFL